MAGQFLERRIGAVGRNELYQFHFFELVLANHAAGILAIRACLRTKTGRVRHIFPGHICCVENIFPGLLTNISKRDVQHGNRGTEEEQEQNKYGDQ